jgi:hypothetical protein
MIEKIEKPVRFDKEQSFLIIARDGEKFYVANESVVQEDPTMDLIEMGARSLLQWALEVNYPLRKFIKLQKLLVEKYFEP